METLETHVKNLVVLTSDHQRKAYLRRCPELYSDENVRLLCRQAVALLFSNVADSRNLCHVLTAIAQTRRTPLTSAYRDHAWGAAYYKGGVDYRRALARWKRAVTYFERAGRSDEAAITRLSALPTLACLDQLDLFAEWVNSARASFESKGDRLRLARLAANTAISSLPTIRMGLGAGRLRVGLQGTDWRRSWKPGSLRGPYQLGGVPHLSR